MLDALIVEDDAPSREALATWIERQGLLCRQADDLASARSAVEERLPDLAVVDLELPDGSGLALLDELRGATDTDVVMVSGCTTVDAAIEALRLGAADFLTKPVELRRLEVVIKNLARTAELRQEVVALRSELKKLGRFGELVGESRVMRDVYELIERVAPTREVVLITGATGTGKELTATTIHRLSGRGKGPFVAINCGAVAPSLIESEIFGHERGAFTGADRRRKGIFEQAHGGTLFLDEITEMPLELQVKLLRVLETGSLVRLGSSSSIDVDVRVLAATNRDPEEAVEQGLLRRDLLYRLLVFPIHLPRLAERDDDVTLLAQAFLARLNEEHETLKRFTDGALNRLRAHDWPGNVRELDNAVRRAFILSPRDIKAAAIEVPEGSLPQANGAEGQLVVAPGTPIAEVEQRLIEATLELLDGNKKRAAKALGISVKTLYARLKVYAAARGAT